MTYLLKLLHLRRNETWAMIDGTTLAVASNVR
jgi:hypothetical protein